MHAVAVHSFGVGHKTRKIFTLSLFVAVVTCTKVKLQCKIEYETPVGFNNEQVEEFRSNANYGHALASYCGDKSCERARYSRWSMKMDDEPHGTSAGITFEFDTSYCSCGKAMKQSDEFRISFWTSNVRSMELNENTDPEELRKMMEHFELPSIKFDATFTDCKFSEVKDEL